MLASRHGVLARRSGPCPLAFGTRQAMGAWASRAERHSVLVRASSTGPGPLQRPLPGSAGSGSSGRMRALRLGGSGSSGRTRAQRRRIIRMIQAKKSFARILGTLNALVDIIKFLKIWNTALPNLYEPLVVELMTRHKFIPRKPYYWYQHTFMSMPLLDGRNQGDVDIDVQSVLQIIAGKAASYIKDTRDRNRRPVYHYMALLQMLRNIAAHVNKKNLDKDKGWRKIRGHIILQQLQRMDWYIKGLTTLHDLLLLQLTIKPELEQLQTQTQSQAQQQLQAWGLLLQLQPYFKQEQQMQQMLVQHPELAEVADYYTEVLKDMREKVMECLQ